MAAVLPNSAAEKIDTNVNAKIRQEETSHSQVMRTLHFLTDVHGPRLTGLPAHKEAAEWAVKQMTEWGFTNDIYSWDFGHPGWTNDYLSVHIVSPVKDALVVEALAWTPGTDGRIRGRSSPNSPTGSGRRACRARSRAGCARARRRSACAATIACSASTSTVSRGGGDGHDLLGEHVERVARHHGALDQALAHALATTAHSSRSARNLGKMRPSRRRRRRGRRARCAAARRSPTSATRPAGRGPRRPCRCPARATRSRRGRQLAGLQLLLDDEALLAGERAVVGARDRAGRRLGLVRGLVSSLSRSASRSAARGC